MGELSKRFEDIRESLEIINFRPTCNPFPRQLEAKFCSVVKSSSDISRELRLYCMPEISMGSDSKIKKSKFFEHDEKTTSDKMKFLGVNAEETSSFRRLGNFNATNKRPRQTSAKFRNVITAEGLFARATMLKNYKAIIKGNKY